MPFLQEVMRLTERYGVRFHIKISDTLGLGLPFMEAPLPRSIPRLIRFLVDDMGVDSEGIEFHGHNDFHLVIANHLAAWVYGASLSNCTLLGIGERAGNCPLEAMAIFYDQLKGGSQFNFRALPKVKDLFIRMGFNVPEFYPLLGDNAFRTKAGIHIDGLLKNPQIYLPFDPETVMGVPYTVEVTPYSGRAGLLFWMVKKFGIKDWKKYKNDERVDMAYKEVLKKFEEGRKEPLKEEEVVRIVLKYIPELVR